MPAKILLLKYDAQKCAALACYADEATLYWHGFGPSEAAEALRLEQFQLVIADIIGAAADPIAKMDELRRQQEAAHLFVICGKLELPQVVRAIRLGVRDVFNPPLDFAALAERIESVLRSPRDPAAALVDFDANRWAKVTEFFGLGPATEPAATAATKASPANAATKPAAAPGSHGHPPQNLKTENDKLSRELQLARQDVQWLQEESDRMRAEVERLRVEIGRLRDELQAARPTGGRATEKPGGRSRMPFGHDQRQPAVPAANGARRQAEKGIDDAQRRLAEEKIALERQREALIRRETELRAKEDPLNGENARLRKELADRENERALLADGWSSVEKEAAHLNGLLKQVETSRRKQNPKPRLHSVPQPVASVV
ncbi:MAG: hypothetical protein A3G75_15055 [Verrucomicrobia bacterium RIFCSPLOWO2_12_FULL_64_8]|nr:MAG: hypothetical protein A3G75_15055 [Verrucomicrobia bacterium RIFCSPLOWO2_12_FULL_64_8]